MSQIKLDSELTCPECGHKRNETMPTDSCQIFYECTACGATLKPLGDDCCVFCSYGTVSCPPLQEARLAGKDQGCCS